MRQSKIVVALLVLLSAGIAFGVDKKIISPAATKPGGNYSQGILVDGTLYISGQRGEDAACNVVSVLVYLNEAGKFQRMNALYRNYFRDPRPTRTTVVAAGLGGPGNIEITVTARK